MVGTKDPCKDDIAVVVSDSSEGEDEDAAESQRRLAQILSPYAAFRTLPAVKKNAQQVNTMMHLTTSRPKAEQPRIQPRPMEV